MARNLAGAVVLRCAAAIAAGLTGLWPAAAGAIQAVVASDPARYEAGFEQPSAVATDSAGRVYVLDGAHHRIVALTPDGGILRTLGGAELLKLPMDFALSEEGLVVADTGHHRLVLLHPDGTLRKTLDLAIEPMPEPSPQPDRSSSASPLPKLPPEPVAVSVQDGIAFWADRRSHRLCRIRLTDGRDLGCFGGRGEEPGQFQYPFQIAQDRDGYFNVVDIVNARIQVFDKSGRAFSQIGRFGFDDGELFRPNGLAIDREQDALFVSDGYFGTISVFRKGEFLGLLRQADGQPVKLDSPTGLHFRDGRLYVAETGASRVWSYRVSYPGRTVSSRGGGLHTELSQKNCLLCHLSWAGDAPPEVRAADMEGALPEASYRMCYSCHNGAVMDSRLAIHRGAQHPTVYESPKEKKRHAGLKPRKDKLPDKFPVTRDKQLLCTSCHTPHTDAEKAQTLYPAHGNAWLRIPNRGGDLCERCHESKVKGARLDAPLSTGSAEGKKGPKGLNHPLGVRFVPPPHPEAKGYPSETELRKGLPERLAAGGAALGDHEELICQTCHQVHGGHGDGKTTVVETAKGELCAACHRRQFTKSKEEAHEKGVHPVNVKREPDESGARPVLWKGKPEITEVGCQTCHRVHDGSARTPLLPEGVANAESLCKNCHERQHAENENDARKKGVHPVNAELEEPVRIGGREVRTVGCLSCHSVHGGKPHTAALVETDRDGELCSHCHKQKQTVVGTDHDLRITAKDEKNALGELPSETGVCGSCHTLHRGKGDRRFLFAARKVKPQPGPAMDETPFKRDGLCLNCHQKGGVGGKKVVHHFSHPQKDLVLRSDQKILPLLGAKEEPEDFGGIACITCHEPHVWDADKIPPPGKDGTIALSANRENLEGSNRDAFLRAKDADKVFCVDCHGLGTLVKYKYYHDARRARNGGVDYLR
ncbi:MULTISPECIES: cytochrome c3 family protein [Methylococcus]|uniref:NHL domain/cytochrome c family protein n=1 Tax=Methylococcus capsulatus TaxID=414 RepID=A0ABZ2F7K7_METCP|nr:MULTISPECIES: cytochrome c3 family protein [Methylococcus]MDF9390919.1 NHL domain/cytochrome c family protein [Methylococcus capsulatus]